MKFFLTLSLLFSLVILNFEGAEAKPDFSGTWVLDTAKSDFGVNAPKQAQMKKIELIIKHTSNQLSVERSTGDTALYKLDGSESVNTLPNNVQAKTKMAWVGDTLVGKTTSTIEGMNVEMDDVRSLDPGGKVMTLKITRQTPRGEVKQTLVYTKQ